MNKLIVATLILSMFILSMMSVSAAISMTLPAASGNYKPTSLAITIAGATAAENITNVTCYYNSSGGVATVFLAEILNSSASQTSFSGTSGVTLAETTTLNVSCNAQNVTLVSLATLSAKGIIIDATSPTLDAKETTISVTQPINYKCSDTYISTFTVAHPNSAGTTVTENLQKSTSDYVQFLSTVEGTYTFTCTDTAGNTATDSVSVTNPTGFAIPSAEAQLVGNGNFLTNGIKIPIINYTMPMWIFLLIVAGGVWYFSSKK